MKWCLLLNHRLWAVGFSFLIVLSPMSGAAEPKLIATLKGHSDDIRSLAFSPDGKLLASGGFFDETVKIWDMPKKRESASVRRSIDYISVQFSPDGKSLILSGLEKKKGFDLVGLVAVMDLETMKDRHVFKAGEGRFPMGLSGFLRIMAITTGLAPDGRTLWAGCSHCARDVGILTFWDLSTGKQIRSLQHSHWFDIITISPDGKLAVLQNYYPSAIKLWDLALDKAVRTLRSDDMIDSMAFSPNGSLLAWTVPGGFGRVLEVATGKELFSFEGYGFFQNGPVFSKDGRFLAAGGSIDRDTTEVRLWTVATGKMLTNFGASDKGVTCLAFSPDSRILATGSVDHTVQLWDISEFTRKPEEPLDGQSTSKPVETPQFNFKPESCTRMRFRERVRMLFR